MSILANVAHATNIADIGMEKSEGCLNGPTEQFGRYLGNWNIQDWQLSREDGKSWVEQKDARWHFTCVGNSVAIQDFWH